MAKTQKPKRKQPKPKKRKPSRHHKRDTDACRIARRQLGLITYSQATARAKLTKTQIRHRVRSGRWRRVRRGVYRVEGVPQSWEQTVLAAVLAAGEGAAACLHTALYLLGVHASRQARDDRGFGVPRASSPAPGRESASHA